MIVFSSCSAALREGFSILDFDPEFELYLVCKDVSTRLNRAREIALAHLDPRPVEVSCDHAL